MKTFALAAFTALICLTFSVAKAEQAKAQQTKEQYPIGQLIALEGKAYYAANDKKTEMKLDDPVFMNTVVETGPASKALILFVDNTQITLGENSELMIDEYVFDPYDPEENKGAFEMTKGPFLWASGLLSKRKDPQVDIKTKAGSIGIRGTKFWGGDVGANQYGVYVFDGKVNFSTGEGQIDIPKDSGAVVGGDKTEFDSQSWPEKRLSDAVATVTFGNQKALDEKIETLKDENVSKQADYRARMFPFKENPLEPRIKSKKDKFFTDEFENMKNKK